MVTLPTQKSVKNLEFKNQKFAILGQAGIGKSEFWAQEPNGLFLETEVGLNALEVFKIPIRSWSDLREAYGLLKKSQDEGKFKYDLVTVDTMDRLVDLAQEEVVEKAKEFYKKIEINTIGDIPQGGGWYKCKEMVNALLTKLELLPCAIAYIAHLSIKHIKETNMDYDKSTISIGGQLGEDLIAWADHILNVEAHLRGDKLLRKVWTKPTQSREAKSRGSVIPDGMLWGEDMKENYNNFRKLFK